MSSVFGSNVTHKILALALPFLMATGCTIKLGEKEHEQLTRLNDSVEQFNVELAQYRVQLERTNETLGEQTEEFNESFATIAEAIGEIGVAVGTMNDLSSEQIKEIKRILDAVKKVLDNRPGSRGGDDGNNWPPIPKLPGVQG